MQYRCLKGLLLGGRRYAPGDAIPEAAFADGRAGRLEAYGYVEKAEDGLKAPNGGRKSPPEHPKKDAKQSPSDGQEDEASNHTDK